MIADTPAWDPFLRSHRWAVPTTLRSCGGPGTEPQRVYGVIRERISFDQAAQAFGGFGEILHEVED